MAKRRFNPSLEEDRTPIVEKLYKANQPTFECAGGFLDDDDERQETREKIAEARQKRIDAANVADQPDDCSICNKALFDSWLWERYNHPICDSCRDDDGEHKLLPRTEVKSEYLLKDEDLDIRKPPLRFYPKKNPHNPRYGDMKLYLKCQVVSRMLEVHGSWEQLKIEKEIRQNQRETRAERAFEKKVKEMRQQIRGTTSMKLKTLDTHEHQYGPEEYDKEADMYSKECMECHFINTYEKL